MADTLLATDASTHDITPRTKCLEHGQQPVRAAIQFSRGNRHDGKYDLLNGMN